MKANRRQILLAMAGAAGVVPLAGCECLLSRVTRELGQSVPEHVAAATTANIDPLFHILQRTSFGVWPGDLERIGAIGADKWIEEQLAPESIDDGLCEMRARRFETLHMDPGMCYEFRREFLRADIVRHTLLRATYSKRQLFEVMVAFWSDHLNINIDKGDCVYLKPADDKQVIRQHALGKFRDLIRASATSPAMLVYLDGKENKRATASDIPNENYARELLELHTLGVDGGYTQQDVFEVARCLTGWRIHDRHGKGTSFFEPDLHDYREKRVLGQTITAGGGAGDLDRVVDICCRHPSTGRHLATKLVKRFVADDPPARLVDEVASAFHRSDGDIKTTLCTIFKSNEFARMKGNKIKRPFHFIVSCLRFTGADTHARPELVEYLMRMGQPPFQFPTPDGYPESPAHWVGTLLWRWNFALALTANQVPNVNVPVPRLIDALCAVQSPQAAVPAADVPAARRQPSDLSDHSELKPSVLKPSVLLPHFLGRTPHPDEVALLESFMNERKDESASSIQQQVLGLILASPAFQRF
jgi:hypothetical protein